MADNVDLISDFWSRGILIPEDLWIHVRSSVRTYVRTNFSQKSAHQIFMIFFMKPRLSNRKKVTVSLFGRKFKIGPFLAKNGPKFGIFGQNSPKSVFLVSRILGDLWIHAHPSVRSFVRASSVSEKSAHEIFGLEESRRPMDSRLSVRTSGFSEKSAHQIFLIFLMNL